MDLLGWSIGKEDTHCYVTVMKSKDIFDISEVSRVDSDPKEGYQRLLNKKRAEDIAKYLNDGNIIPGSIILSAQDGCVIDYNESTNKISINTENGRLFVIDGQHRLYGASLCEEDVLLPVCIFVGLDLKQEVQYFLDINSNQKGVPKTLRIELLKFLSEPESPEAVLIKLFKDLGDDLDSPLFGKTSATTSAPGKISHVPFHNALGSLIEGKTLRKFDFEKKKTLIKNYLSAVSDILVEIEGSDKRLTNSAFFQAIFIVFEDVCTYSLTYFRNYSQPSLMQVLQGIQKLDFEKHSGSNQQTISQMASELQTLLDIHSATLDEPTDLLG
ncbi:DGQHR domain-containing protein [Vibrio parahaemolyticus]|uniref:DGQHR domain-containing protein n=1 Tax=Vibrio diabolicus TaxID=50719 RepID=UPI0015946396|nr:DGQHR domain-containing protein [Vibrio diabolicus]EHR5465205.1 DGQHR domain-containing protein [Vibrio parahaemolyticus]ELH9566171.1 DGQHR domain-containing protein [Vibrio parahaemolyticus]NVC49829.1 DGQHR domain-containing protein [Vibrio diabolicus]HCG5955195.1 DGQHR domain-containing protein [Vibrio parahaemolyticus]